MVDARILQTQAALAEAILDLASERQVSEISVFDIARRAGINRATFYNHYASPGALLAAVITTELDEIRAADHALRASGGDSAEAHTRNTVDAVVGLVERHRALFERNLLDASDASLHRALSGHFDDSARQHLGNYAATPVDSPDANVVARFVAEGIVGGIEMWLEEPTLTTGELTDAIVSAMPRWWH